MTAMWFGLAVIALLGALALLYVDRSRRVQAGRVRELWAKAQGYRFTEEDADLSAQFSRAAMANQAYLPAIDIVRGVRRGEQFTLFDVEDTTTIVAVRRAVGSDVDIDLRLKSAAPPRDADMELLGAIGPRVVFSTDVDIARRVCDQRMVAFAESIPPQVQMLWSENEWTLGSIAVNSNGRDWDAAIDSVARLSGLLHVLPPLSRMDRSQEESSPRRFDRSVVDPGRPLVREPHRNGESRPNGEPRQTDESPRNWDQDRNREPDRRFRL